MICHHRSMGILWPFFVENKNKIQRVFTGYDISGRRNNKIGGKIKGGLDCTVVDELGGWRENWKAIYIGKKC